MGDIARAAGTADARAGEGSATGDAELEITASAANAPLIMHGSTCGGGGAYSDCGTPHCRPTMAEAPGRPDHTHTQARGLRGAGTVN